MPSIEWNTREWGASHRWEFAGDEWSDLAEYCGQPYAEWKDSLVGTFIDRLMPVGAAALEIAPGYGRWTEHLLPRASRLDIVDINENCLGACVERFSEDDRLVPHLSPGACLPFIAADSVDFLWSFDSFVHMDPVVVRGYVREIGRVLRPGGRAVIHHAGLTGVACRLHPVLSGLGGVGRAAMTVIGQGRWRDDGNRSPVTASDVVGWGRDASLHTESQTDSWGERDQYTVTKYRDAITVFVR